MTSAFSWPPRHAPGYPSDCADTGDVLARFAARGHQSATVVVVTSALRASVEDSGDHETGLDRVRRSLAAMGRALESVWNPSYYGKELVLIRAGNHAFPIDLVTSSSNTADTRGVRHGWATEHLALAASRDEQREQLLRTCYLVSMAARMRRDRPDLLSCQAEEVLRSVPEALSMTQAASLLAGVLVRPLGGRATASGAASDEDPRFPGIASADAWAIAMEGSHRRGMYTVTDVHDIEWGTLSREGSGGQVTEGNAQQLLPLASVWLRGSTPVADVVERAYRIRVRRESVLLGHLRTLSDTVSPTGRLFATLGDGLSGIVSGAAGVRSAVKAANSWTAGQMHSGAGVAALDEEGVVGARHRSHFSLHVTKTLKGTAHRQRLMHEFGEVLSSDAADSAVSFLTALEEAGPGAPGYHHLAHARRWHTWWCMHLPPRQRGSFSRLLESPRAGAADT